MYRRFLRRLPLRKSPADRELEVISQAERAHLLRTYRWCIAISMAFSVVGYLSYYLPYYYLPEWFPNTTIPLPWIGTVSVGLVGILWGFLLGYIEISLLFLLQLFGVHEVALATGFVHDAKSKAEKEQVLLDVGMDKSDRAASSLGINPFQGIHPVALWIYNLVIRLKGFLGNKIIKLLAVRIFGRFGVRWIIDFSGLPLFMAINAYATHKVLTEARVVLFGNLLMERFFRDLPRGLFQTSEGRELLYDTLQLIAVSKRDYHRNHNVLTGRLLEHYQVPVKKEHHLAKGYAQRLLACPEAERQLLQEVLLMGLVLDGHISKREKKAIAELHGNGLFPHNTDAVDVLRKRYFGETA